jgi:hypothetical protein
MQREHADFVILAIVEKRLNLDVSLYTLLQILSAQSPSSRK